jgi:DtxR family Mn-dependent transcriptional regulator
MITVSKEDYLKEIYTISCESGQKVSTSFLASRLSVSNAATTDMAKKLDDAGLIAYEKYKGLKLTQKGKKLALKIIRRHRLWESFLIETLGLSWGEVHDEAEKLEHQTSDFLIDKIDKYLNHPKYDPHGDPIPQKDGKIPDLPDNINLAEAVTGNSYEIVKVNHESNELMEYFSKINIELNTTVKLVDKLNFDNSVSIDVNNSIYTLSGQVASKIFVTLKTEENYE